MNEELDKLREYANKEPSPYLVNPLAPPDQLRDDLLKKITELEVSEKEFIKRYCDMADCLEMVCENLDTVLDICEDNQKENHKLRIENLILCGLLGLSIGFGLLPGKWFKIGKNIRF